MKKVPAVDFHTHVLPRMDDGSESSEMSLQMLHRMKESGTDVVVATSHYYRRRESIDSFLERRASSWERLEQKMDAACPSVILGAETAFYFGMEEDPQLDSLCICGTNTLLVEMPFSQWTDYEVNALSNLCSTRNVHVVLAHYERFDACASPGLRERIENLPLSIQINGEALLPLLGRNRILEMFREGKAHLLGSDSHNLKERAPNLDKARRILEKKLGEETVQSIDRYANTLLFQSDSDE